MDIHAIITGDIVNSRKIPSKAREELYLNLENFLKEITTRGLLKKYEVSRGDSFQCEIVHPHQSLRIAVIIKCFIKSLSSSFSRLTKHSNNRSKTHYLSEIKSVDIRLSIGIGTVDFINDKLATSDGEAFLFSGEGLDQIKAMNQQMFFRSNNPKINEVIAINVLLLDALIQKYTPSQSEVLIYKLSAEKEDEIAYKLGISQSAVNQRARSAFWYAVEATIVNFEKTIF